MSSFNRSGHLYFLPLFLIKNLPTLCCTTLSLSLSLSLSLVVFLSLVLFFLQCHIDFVQVSSIIAGGKASSDIAD